MTDHPTSWFHCGHCGSLFRSPAGDSEERVCTKCGRDPSLGFEVSPGVTAASRERPVRTRGSAGNPRKKRRGGSLPFKLLGGGLVLFAGMLLAAGFVLQRQRARVKPSPQAAPLAGPTLEETVFLTEKGALASQTFSGFLAAGTPEARNQFVLNPIDTASRMARFYDLNPIVNIDSGTLGRPESAVIHLPSGRAMEMQWKTTDGRQIDTVFVEQDNEWRLDWDHYVRFSTYPWALFLAGSGEDEGEFRLLARQRLAEERKDADSISIVLYAPRFGLVNETGFQSPEFLVRRDSHQARLLEAAFKLEKDGKRPFGLKLPKDNPEGLIRVRAKVRRIKDDMTSRFELVDVPACHWYSTDDPGVALSEPGRKD